MLPSAMLCRCGRRHAGTLCPLAARALPCRLTAAALQEVADAILASRSSRTDHHNDLRHVLKSLQQKDPDGHFAHAVDTTLVFDYLDVVSEPMDFSTMCGRSRFASCLRPADARGFSFARASKVNDRRYRSCADFERDLSLIVNNCRAYNEPHSVYYAAANELERWGEMLFNHLRQLNLLQDDDSASSDESSESDAEDESGPPSATQGGAGGAAADWRSSAEAFLRDGAEPSGSAESSSSDDDSADGSADDDGAGAGENGWPAQPYPHVSFPDSDPAAQARPRFTLSGGQGISPA